MPSLSNMCEMRNKHLKQLKGKEGTAKKMLVEKKKIKFEPSATSIAKEQETEPSSIHSTGATIENPGGEGREGASTNIGAWAARHEPGVTWASSVTVSLPTAMPGGTTKNIC